MFVLLIYDLPLPRAHFAAMYRVEDSLARGERHFATEDKRQEGSVKRRVRVSLPDGPAFLPRLSSKVSDLTVSNLHLRTRVTLNSRDATTISVDWRSHAACFCLFVSFLFFVFMLVAAYCARPSCFPPANGRALSLRSIATTRAMSLLAKRVH